MIYSFGDCELDDRLSVLRCAGEPRKLEPKVFEILVYLIRQRDRFVSRDELIEELWPGQVVGEAALTQCVAKARKAVRDDGMRQQVIKTHHGRGYRFIAQVTEHGTEPFVSFQRVETPVQSVSTDDLPGRVVARSRPRYLALQSTPQRHWRERDLALVGVVLIVGVVLTLWHFSSRPSALPGGGYTEKMVTELEGPLVERDHRRLRFLSADSPEASAYCLRGWDSYYRFTPEANAQARQMFARAMAMDPRYATAYVGLGWTYLLEWSSLWTRDPQSLGQALALAQRALTLDDSLPYAHALLGNVYLLQKQYEQAIAEGELAIALDPTCADCYVT
ncbi:MAG TPA: winged helix-turn-helix domain-containing protein, partial [Candidatus Binatia bacterium]|nr:winged helix-turn-helix domain-containing protein [Candidatus Binatia bacterium]